MNLIIYFKRNLPFDKFQLKLQGEEKDFYYEYDYNNIKMKKFVLIILKYLNLI